ncbi:MAG: lysophospholipid acyltransferase family protein [Chloroflexota bacterium]|nr:lysophospholipid acyltransferase family protein [Chloroflexota bacterium]
MNSNYEIPFINKIYRRILRAFFQGIFRLLGPVRIIGKENVPQEAPYVIAMNHVSILEVPFIGSFWPIFPEIIGAADVWRRPGQAIFARMYHGLPVHRGEYDRRALAIVIDVLKAGKILLISPEGTRSHTPGLQRAKSGIAYIVDKTQVPVVPVGIVGTTEDYFKNGFTGKRPILEMRIGKPIQLPPIKGHGEERREARQQNTDKVMAHIAALLPPEYRGEYTNFEDLL